LSNGVFDLSAQARELRDSFPALHGAKGLHTGETDFLGDSPEFGDFAKRGDRKIANGGGQTAPFW
jgi:hypothetical protein